MTKKTKWKDDKRQKQKVTSDKTDLHSSPITPLPHFRPINYIE